jgi:hypothetical protein
LLARPEGNGGQSRDDDELAWGLDLPRHRTAATLSLVRPKLSTANPPTQAFSDDWCIYVIAASLKSVWETSALPLTAIFLLFLRPK